MNDLGRHYDYFLHNRVKPRRSHDDADSQANSAASVDLAEKIKFKQEMEKEKALLADRQRQIMVDLYLRKSAIAEHLPAWQSKRKNVREKNALALKQREQKIKENRDRKIENEYRRLEREGEVMIRKAKEERKRVREAMFTRKAVEARQDAIRKQHQDVKEDELQEIINGAQEAKRDIGSPTRIGRGIVPGHASSAVRSSNSRQDFQKVKIKKFRLPESNQPQKIEKGLRQRMIR